MKINLTDNLLQSKFNFSRNRYVSGLTNTQKKKIFTEMAKVLDISHDTVRNDLLRISENSDKMRAELLANVIEKNKKSPGFLICDSTILPKEYAKKIEGIATQGSSKTVGINAVATIWTDFKEVVAVNFFTWECGTKTSYIEESARQLVALAQKIEALGVIADGAFSSKEAIKIYQEAHVYFVMRFHSNRVVSVKRFKDSNQIAQHRAFKLKRNNRFVMHKITWDDLHFSVACIKINHKTKGWMRMFLCTNLPLQDAKTIANIYVYRWEVEVFFRKCKQDYGLKDCLLRKMKHQEAHCLVILLLYNKDENNIKNTVNERVAKKINLTARQSLQASQKLKLSITPLLKPLNHRNFHAIA